MDEAGKKILIDKLVGEPDAFLSDYSVQAENPKWFIRKIIDYFIKKSIPDAQLEPKVREIIVRATKAAKDKVRKKFRDHPDAKHKWTGYSDGRSRTQIIYGLIAIHPEFAETANSAYFDFIIERRCRSIHDLMYFVNADSEKFFDYPSTACPRVKVNKEASDFWSDTSGFPFYLKTKGLTQPTAAVEAIFEPNKLCDRNISPCDPAATILHMDGLLEAKDNKELFKHLVSEGPDYLKIDHPFAHGRNSNRLLAETATTLNSGTNVEVEVGIVGLFLSYYDLAEADYNDNKFIPFNPPISCVINQGNQFEKIKVTSLNPVTRKIKIASVVYSYPVEAKIYLDKDPYPPFHFLSDSRPEKALFEQRSIKLDDLQVGDHIYIRNHPLYSIITRNGFWGGEHSFVLEIGSRSIKERPFEASFKVAGHGLGGTILKMATSMLDIINTQISVLQSITAHHLGNLNFYGLSPSANVQVIPRNENGIDYIFFEYDTVVRYTKFSELGEEKIIQGVGFVVRQKVNETTLFTVVNSQDHRSLVPSFTPAVDIHFLQPAPIASAIYKYDNWGIKYYNDQTNKFGVFRFFEANNKTRKMMTFDDLKASVPFARMNDNTDVFVTRPRVDFSVPYQNFLIAKGAI